MATHFWKDCLYTNNNVTTSTVDTESLLLSVSTDLVVDIIIGLDNQINIVAGGATFVLNKYIIGTSYNSAKIISEWNSYNSVTSGTTNTKLNEPFRTYLINLAVNEAPIIARNVNNTNNFIVLTTKKWFSSDEYSIGTKLCFKNINFDTSTSASGEETVPDFYVANSEYCNDYDTNEIAVAGYNWWFTQSSTIGGFPYVWHFYTPSTQTWFYTFANRVYSHIDYGLYGLLYLTSGNNDARWSSGFYGGQGLTYETDYIVSSGFKGNIELLDSNWKSALPTNPNSISIYGDSSTSGGGSTTTSQNIGGKRQFEKEIFTKFLERKEGHSIIGLEHSVNLPESTDLNTYGEIKTDGIYKTTNVPDVNPTVTRLFDTFFIPFDYTLDYDVTSNTSAKVTIDSDFALPQTKQELGNGIGINISMQNILALNIITENIDFTKLYSSV